MDLLARLMEVGQSGVSVRALGRSRSGEVRFGRFLRCDAVTPEEMIAMATAYTKGLVAGRHILAIQDTTLRDDGIRCSLNLHPTIAADAEDGTLFGLVHAAMLSRDGSAAKEQQAAPSKRRKAAADWTRALRAWRCWLPVPGPSPWWAGRATFMRTSRCVRPRWTRPKRNRAAEAAPSCPPQYQRSSPCRT
jgi:hypothetical protein